MDIGAPFGCALPNHSGFDVDFINFLVLRFLDIFMARDWTYPEIKEIRILVGESSDVVAQHLNHKFHGGSPVRTRACVEKVKRTIHVLFDKKRPE